MEARGTAYFLWLVSIFGWLGFHRVDHGEIGKGMIWMLTGGVFGIDSLIDLCTRGIAVERCNTDQELKTIRTASMVNAVAGSTKEE